MPVLNTKKEPKKKASKEEVLIEAERVIKKELHIAARIAIFCLEVTFLTTMALVLITSSAVFAYKSEYKNRAYFGTKILGMEVGGKNLAEVDSLVKAKISKITFSFDVDGQKVVATPADAGVTFNAAATSQKAVAAGKTGNWYQPWTYAAESLLYKVAPKTIEKYRLVFKNNLVANYITDDGKMAILAQSLSQSFNVQSQNAGLVMKGSDVQVVPAIYGKKILTDNIKDQIAIAVKSSQSANISIQAQKVNPAIVEADTQKSITAAKAMLSIPVRFHYQGKNFTPDQATVGSWIVFNAQNVGGKDQLVPAVDAKLVYPYIYGLAGQINVAAVNKKITVTNGANQTVDQEGKDGLAVNVDSASYTTAVALSASKSVDLELPTYAVKAKTTVNNITVADWSKYIDVNISTQTMCAYLAGGNQQACWAITSGRDGMSTPTGTFLIQRKVFVTSMPNPPSPYPLNNIHYVSYFTAAGHAIHEAWWRSSFGGQDYHWNGSHGCVNASIGVAQWIYDWAPIGTPVIIHY